ncbi:MAG: 3-hydroxyacyl-CoA dehydrogenase NAD-binding domain-containing protein [Caulobacteraceae bacterium]
MHDAAPVRRRIVDGVAVVTLDNPPVNALSAALRTAAAEVLKAAEADPTVQAIVILGAGGGFSGGADITEFGKPPAAPTLRNLLEIVEAISKPTVGAIHGVAFGGGLELALACHFRVADHTARIALPEVKLGLLPGGGGTQRLPRLVGVETALNMIVSGDPVRPDAARMAGLVDAVIDGDLEAGAIAFAKQILVDKRALVRTRDRADKIEAARADQSLFDRFKAANARRFKGFAAPAKCVEAVQAAVDLPFETGMALERKLFDALQTSGQSAAQRYAFFAKRQAAKIDVPQDTPKIPIRKVGVLGAGTMGGGIAMAFLNAAIPVTLVEARPEALERGVGVIRKTYEATADKGRLTREDVEARMGLLTPTLAFDQLADCDLVIEAVFEDMAVKKEVFARLDRVAKSGAILATNTSYLDVDEISQVTTRSDSVIGLHFFSPANIMPLLEVVRGANTSPQVIATAMSLAKTLDKVGVLVRVGYGFVGNRMLAVRRREADKLVLEGARPIEVDRVMTDFGLPMGPFQITDLAGLDIGWNWASTSSSTVREVLCEMGRFGQKAGGGYYAYDADRKASPSPVAEQVIRDFAARQGIAQREVSDQEILERLVYPMVNEGAKLLEENIAQRASDIDVVWVNGYGWPGYRGGPMFYADQIGAKFVLQRLGAYQVTGGDDYKPAALLERLVATGGCFQDL